MIQQSTEVKKAIFAKMRVDTPHGRQIYKPDELQSEIHFGNGRYHVACLGRRRGKTYCLGAEFIAGLSEKNFHSWAVAPTYELTDRVFSFVWEQVIINEIYGGNSAIRHASKTRDNRYIETKWGSWIKGKSAESPKSLKGEQLDLIGYDECAEDDELIWLQYLEPCLLDRRGRAIFISTPKGYNWFKNYYHRGEMPEFYETGWRCYHSPTWENPFLNQEDIAALKRQTPALVWNQEYGAKFEQFSGLIYPDYCDRLKPDGHLFDPERDQVNPSWTHFRGIDLGFRHPTACVWCAVDPSGNIWFYQEYEESGLVHEVHAEQISALTTYPVAITYLPHDAKKRQPMKKVDEPDVSAWKIYQKAGIYSRMSPMDVDAGYAIVSRYLLATREDHPTHGKIFISKDCKRLRDAFLRYVWAEPRSIRDLDAPQKPKKANDHLMDALRGVVSTSPRHRPNWEYEKDDKMLVDDNVRYGYTGSRRAFNRPRKRKQAFPGQPFVIR